MSRWRLVCALCLFAVCFLGRGVSWVGLYPCSVERFRAACAPRTSGGGVLFKPRAVLDRGFVHRAVHESLDRLNELAEAGEVVEAEAVFARAVREIPIAQRTMAWNTMIKACANRGDLQRAEYWHCAMSEGQVRMNEKTYGKLIETAARVQIDGRSGDAVAADLWLRRMVGDGFVPNIVCITAVIDAYLKQGNTDAAQSWQEWALAAGLTPDMAYFNMRVSSFAEIGDALGAERWCNVAVSGGLLPDMITYGALITAWGNAGNHAKATEWLQVAESKQLHPDIIMYNSIISSRAKIRDIVGAQEWMQRAVGAGLKPDVITYTAVIEACARGGDMKAAEAWMDMAIEQRLCPDVVTFNLFVDAYAKQGCATDASRWLMKAIVAGTQPDLIMYNAVINGCASRADLEGAQEWLNEAISRGLQPDVITYTALIKGHGMRCDIKGAEHILDIMLAARVRPDVISWTSFIRACGRVKKRNAKAGNSVGANAEAAAERALNRMVENGINPSQITLEALDGVLGAQRREELWQEIKTRMLVEESASPGSLNWRRSAESREGNRYARRLSETRRKMKSGLSPGASS